jgi:hypothetical protein
LTRSAFRPKQQQNPDAKWKSGLCPPEQHCRERCLHSRHKEQVSRSSRKQRSHQPQSSLRHCSRRQQHRLPINQQQRHNLRLRRGTKRKPQRFRSQFLIMVISVNQR